MKKRDYPGHDLPKKELLARLFEAYQVAGRLLLEGGVPDPKEVRDEMVIVLLDFLSDPTTVDMGRLKFAAGGFQAIWPRTVTASTANPGMTQTWQYNQATGRAEQIQ